MSAFRQMFNHRPREMPLQIQSAPRGFEATNFVVEYGPAEVSRKAGLETALVARSSPAARSHGF